MKSVMKKGLGQFRRDLRGNISIMAVAWISAFTGIAGLTTDVSLFYYAKKQLQTSTDAAALAAVQDIDGVKTDIQIKATATAYSATTGNQNADSRFTATMASGYPQLKCFAQVTAQGIPCTSASGQTSANGIVVKQTASVPTYFSKIFGYSSTNISATSTAAYKGGGTTNLDIFFVVDTTASMDSTTNANCSGATRIECAKDGMENVMKALKACSGTSCTSTTGVATNPVNQVGLIAFPPRATTSGNVAKDYDCSTSTSPTTVPYNTSASSMSYMVLPLQSDYKSTPDATTLNTSSNIVKAVGAGGTGCVAGLQAPGGQGSFLAGAITAAKNALTMPATGVTNTSNVRANSTKVIVVLSDGDAAASSSKVTTATNQCTQGVTAATAAKTAGILVYTIAYGAGSGGCSTDTGSSATTACNSMKAMATVGTDTSKFYSNDGTATGSGKCPSTNNLTTLSAIFNSIQGSISSAAGANPRLIPDSTI